MSFLDEADSLKSKLHLGSINPFMLLGIVVILLIVIGFAVVSASSFFMNGFGSNADSESLVIKSEDSENSETKSDSEKTPTVFYVHVGGAVISPGLFELPEGSRVNDAIDAAGGFSEDADVDSINLAEVVTDGQHLVVSSKQAQVASTETAQTTTAQSTGKININTASLSDLKTLDGVGDATAQKIIDYRQTQGSFTKPEDLKNVSGIGDKRYDAIKDKICV